MVVFNRGKSDATVTLDVSPELRDGEYTETLSGNKVTVRDGKLNVSLPGQTAAFVTAK